jgi:hypothetical protein
MGTVMVKTLSRFGCRRAVVSSATVLAQCASRQDVVHRAHYARVGASVGRPRPDAGHAARPVRHCGWTAAGRSRAVPRAELGFGLEAVLKLKIPFLFFIRFQTEFKLQKFISKYLELQKL